MSEMDKKVLKRVHRIMEAAISVADKFDGYHVRNRIEEIRIHYNGYAEPGYDTKSGLIATANWNDIGEWNEVMKQRETVSDLPPRICNLFEKLGVEIEWSDEWCNCSDCGKLVRTTGNSYSWKASFYVTDGELICHECAAENPDAYFESLEGKIRSCATLDIDPAKHGYIKFNKDSYENGWHPGQNDNPKDIAEQLDKMGIDRFLFLLDAVGQFDLVFSVYIHESEKEKLNTESKDESESEEEDDDDN